MRNDADQQHWLDAIISLQEAAELRGISIKTLAPRSDAVP